MEKNRQTLEITQLQPKIKTLPISASAFYFSLGRIFAT
jgi:hypothetical protein